MNFLYSNVLSNRCLWLPSLIVFSLVFLFLIFVGGAAYSADTFSERPSIGSNRALGPVLLVDGGDSDEANQWYHDSMDTMFGVGGWDVYDMIEQGMPNTPELFKSILGPYRGVLWHVDSRGMDNLLTASHVLTDCVSDAPESGMNGKLFTYCTSSI